MITHDEFVFDPRSEGSIKYPPSVYLLVRLSVFISGTVNKNFLLFLREVKVSPILKSDEACFFEKILFWFFWAKRPQTEIFKFFENWTCGIFLIFCMK